MHREQVWGESQVQLWCLREGFSIGLVRTRNVGVPIKRYLSSRIAPHKTCEIRELDNGCVKGATARPIDAREVKGAVLTACPFTRGVVVLDTHRDAAGLSAGRDDGADCALRRGDGVD